MHDALPVYLSYAAAILFGYVAFHEIVYAVGHPHAHGPAMVIAVGALAGVLTSLAVALVANRSAPTG